MITSTSSKLHEHPGPQIPFLRLGACYQELKEEYDAAYHRVMDSGWYILGQELEAFEAEFAAYCGAEYCVGVGNGLEALLLILKGYGVGDGDEVIVPANTYIASWLAVTHSGAQPVPVEPLMQTANLDPDRIARAVTSRTRAIMAVHLYGQPAMMDAVREVADRHRLPLIADAAQAHGAKWDNQPVGALADASGFSFYPTKNLGAFGDGGAIVSNDRKLIDSVLLLRNYGSRRKYYNEVCGFNSRLDPLQAAFLRVRLKHLDEWNARRERIAETYSSGLALASGCTLPFVAPLAKPCWHLFVIRHPKRDRLQQYLQSRGIETAIHYPVPPHLSQAYVELGYQRGDFPITEALADSVLSLPIGPHLDRSDAERVIQAIQDFGVQTGSEPA